MGLTQHDLDVEFCITVVSNATKIADLERAMQSISSPKYNIPKMGWVVAALQAAIDRQVQDTCRWVEREEARKSQAKGKGT